MHLKFKCDVFSPFATIDLMFLQCCLHFDLALILESIHEVIASLLPSLYHSLFRHIYARMDANKQLQRVAAQPGGDGGKAGNPTRRTESQGGPDQQVRYILIQNKQPIYPLCKNTCFSYPPYPPYPCYPVFLTSPNCHCFGRSEVSGKEKERRLERAAMHRRLDGKKLKLMSLKKCVSIMHGICLRRLMSMISTQQLRLSCYNEKFTELYIYITQSMDFLRFPEKHELIRANRTLRFKVLYQGPQYT